MDKIKAGDLRIGNFVIDEDGDVLEIICIEKEYVWHDVNIFSQIDTIRGIILTPEILGQFGFRYCDYLSTRFRYGLSNFYIDRHKKEWHLQGYKHYPKPLTYLHELQNLYYFITGYELEKK
jgi:hypothetical protein